MWDMIHVSSAPWWFQHASGSRWKFNTFKYIFNDCEKIIIKEQQYKGEKKNTLYTVTDISKHNV